MMSATNLSVVGCQGEPVEGRPNGCRGETVKGGPVGFRLDHSSFLKKQWSPLCIRSGEETCW